MRVQFEFSQDDLIDVSKRVQARSKLVRSWRWQGLVTTAMLAWLLVFLLFFGARLKGALIGLVAAGISALIYPGSYRRTVERRLRKILKEKFGDEDSFICEVELLPTGILTKHTTKQTDSQVIHDWSTVEEVFVTDDSVDIFMKGGGVVVRNRAFQSLEERQRFVQLARSYLESSRQAEAKMK
jgi:hypothetical protein